MLTKNERAAVKGFRIYISLARKGLMEDATAGKIGFVKRQLNRTLRGRKG